MFLPRKKETGYETIKRLQTGAVGDLHHVTITGDDAARLLEESTNCRDTNKAKVLEYEDLLRSHGYDVHGDTFDFSSAGREDGTHRLTAIRNVGGEHVIPVKIVPAGTGVAPYFDIGRSRDYKDIAAVNGISLPSREWTIINTYCRIVLGKNLRPHEKHVFYSNNSRLFDEANEIFKSQKSGHHNVFAACWIISQLEVEEVSEKTRKSLEGFCLWLAENYKVVKDTRNGAVCCKLREDWKLLGGQERDKKAILRSILRYSIGRKWEVQKNRTEDSNVVRSDEQKVSDWLGGVK
jgi:hypothetical protein